MTYLEDEATRLFVTAEEEDAEIEATLDRAVGVVQQAIPFALTISDMHGLSDTAAEDAMRGYSHLSRRGYTRFDLFTAWQCGAALYRGDRQAVLTQEVDACHCERGFDFQP
jgi:hypothetical protein